MECDPPVQLLDIFLQKIKQVASDVDFILVPGDMVAHGIPLEPEDPTVGNYDLLKQTLKTVA